MPAGTNDLLSVALLHLAPRPGDIDFNKQLIETAIITAAATGAQWIITPELSICGYSFEPLIGTDWISIQPDSWVAEISELAARLHVVVFLSVAERDRESNLLYNAVFVIGSSGAIQGKHRKINTLRVGSEAWSSPGSDANPIDVEGRRVGLMICADAYSPIIPSRLHVQGAQFLVSPAAWPPGEHGPNGEWERATSATGLPLFVCNRTGPDLVLDFSAAESSVVYGGKRIVSAASHSSVALLFQWNLVNSCLESSAFHRVPLEK